MDCFASCIVDQLEPMVTCSLTILNVSPRLLSSFLSLVPAEGFGLIKWKSGAEIFSLFCAKS